MGLPDVSQEKPPGFVRKCHQIIKKEGFPALYKGLGAVLTGIVPKMAIRFTSYEFYKQLLADDKGVVSGPSTTLGARLPCPSQI